MVSLAEVFKEKLKCNTHLTITHKTLIETIDLKELLENPERFDSLSMDIKYSAVVNLSELLRSDRKIASKLFKFAVAIPPEFVVLLLMSEELRQRSL